MPTFSITGIEIVRRPLEDGSLHTFRLDGSNQVRSLRHDRKRQLQGGLPRDRS